MTLRFLKHLERYTLITLNTDRDNKIDLCKWTAWTWISGIGVFSYKLYCHFVFFVFLANLFNLE